MAELYRLKSARDVLNLIVLLKLNLQYQTVNFKVLFSIYL